MSENQVVDESQNPVLEPARKPAANQPVTTLSGVRVILRPTPANIIAEVMQAIPEPAVPTYINPETQKEEPNPNSPKYDEAMREYNIKRNQAAMDAAIFYGVKLLDPVPPTAEWLNDVQWLFKRQGVELKVNLEDVNEVRFLYLKYVVVDAGLLMTLMELSGVSDKEVAQAKAQFRS